MAGQMNTGQHVSPVRQFSGQAAQQCAPACERSPRSGTNFKGDSWRGDAQSALGRARGLQGVLRAVGLVLMAWLVNLGLHPASLGQPVSTSAASKAASAATATSTPGAPLTLITEPRALQTAAQHGAALAPWFDAQPNAQGGSVMAELARQAPWRSLRLPIAAELNATRRADLRAGVGMGHAHRQFDVRWLDSPTHFFELVAVVNRLDRRAFHDTPSTPAAARACGEVRLIYRLAYRQPQMQSRLPMTLGVELLAPPPDAAGSCAHAVRRWQAPAGLTGEALGRWLVSVQGPLPPEQLRRTRLHQIAVNLQTVRWPSGVRPDLGGHAEYALMALKWQAAEGAYTLLALENTPDLHKLAREPRSRAELLAWLQQPAQRAALDAGTLQIPERFLARVSRSVTPGGMGRLANRPFAQLWSADELAAVAQPGAGAAPAGGAASHGQLSTGADVLRRLNDLSCAGCHQSRSVAGFHVLGEDAPGSRSFTAGNAIAVPHSPHVQDEIARRAAYLRQALAQPVADPYRPLALLGARAGGPGSTQTANAPAQPVLGQMGEICRLAVTQQVPSAAQSQTAGQGALTGLGPWACAADLQCQPAVGEPGFGLCMPAVAQAGSLCEPARITASANPAIDRAQRLPSPGCSAASPVCEATAVGFPEGMCSGACTPGEPGCGQIAVLDAFNRCLAQHRPFAQCLQHTRPGQLQTCSATQACRGDYLCAQALPGRRAGGLCMPPYFLFQMRVDGHP